jgi:hypothetical protein
MVQKKAPLQIITKMYYLNVNTLQELNNESYV